MGGNTGEAAENRFRHRAAGRTTSAVLSIYLGSTQVSRSLSNLEDVFGANH